MRFNIFQFKFYFEKVGDEKRKILKIPTSAFLLPLVPLFNRIAHLLCIQKLHKQEDDYREENLKLTKITPKKKKKVCIKTIMKYPIPPTNGLSLTFPTLKSELILKGWLPWNQSFFSFFEGQFIVIFHRGCRNIDPIKGQRIRKDRLSICLSGKLVLFDVFDYL